MQAKLQLPENEIHALYASMDQDEDGMVSVEELSKHMAATAIEDTDGDGKVDLDDLTQHVVKKKNLDGSATGRVKANLMARAAELGNPPELAVVRAMKAFQVVTPIVEPREGFGLVVVDEIKLPHGGRCASALLEHAASGQPWDEFDPDCVDKEEEEKTSIIDDRLGLTGKVTSNHMRLKF